MKAPNIVDQKELIAIKRFEIAPVVFKNTGDEITQVSITPSLPLGLHLSIENKTIVLRGTPTEISARRLYTITASNDLGQCNATIEMTVIEAPIRTQRGEIIAQHDARGDLDTPRSQVDHAMSDEAMLGNTIKPHEKFAHQPMGDDKRLTNQAANNPEAENRAQSQPELTPSPSAKLQQQATLSATPQITPAPRK